VTLVDVPAIEPVDERQPGEQRRWDRWQERYARSSRRTGIQARIVAAVLLVALAVLLFMQFLATFRVA
jgi:hypothetical protein